MNKNLNDIIDKMGKLLVRSIDPSSADSERSVAGKALQKLSERYDISIDAVEAGREPTLDDIGELYEHVNNSG